MLHDAVLGNVWRLENIKSGQIVALKKKIFMAAAGQTDYIPAVIWIWD